MSEDKCVNDCNTPIPDGGTWGYCDNCWNYVCVSSTLEKQDVMSDSKISVQGQLVYNNDKEVGEAIISNLPRDMVGLDMLNDWMCDIRELYEELHNEVFPRTRGGK